MLASAVFIALIIGSAQTGLAAPLHAVSGYTVTIPAGSTGTIPVRAISLRPGSNLSSDALSLAAQPLAADNVRTALYYGIDWGYAETAPYQVALAVWWVQDSVWQAADHATAEQIGSTALNSPGTPSWNPAGVSLLSLVQSGQVTVAPLSLTASAQYPAVGSGSLHVTNISANEVSVFLPYGTVFGSSAQALVWAGGEGSQGPAVTPTNAPEATSTTANPAAPSATPVSTGKGGGQPVEPTATAKSKSVPGKGKSTPVASNTPAPPADNTATPLPTATTVPTLAPTDTPQPAPTEASAKVGANTGIPGDQSPKAPVNAGTAGSQSPASESVEAPAAPSIPQNTNTNNQEGKSQPGTGAAGGVVAQPDRSMQGPVLPNATTTPVGDQSGSVPAAVGTAGAPEAVTTSQPGVGAPSAQATGEASVPDAIATRDSVFATASSVPTEPVKPTAVPPTAVVDTGSSDGALPGDLPTVEVPPADIPTPETKPTPAPTPAPAPNDGGVTVDASTDGQSGSSGDASGSASADGGAAPTTNPTTGGGRSDLTTWLGLAAAMMMLGGWVLRLKGRTPVPVRAKSDNE